MTLNEMTKNMEIYKKLSGLASANSLNQSVIFTCNDLVLADSLIENLLIAIMGDEVKIKSKTHPDVFYYPQNDKKSILVEDVERIIDDSQVKAIEGEKKVFVIKCDELFGASPQNKLLKTLEEPNKNVYYFLLTKSLNQVLPTIQSRCLKVSIDGLGLNQFKNLGFSDEEFLFCGGNLEKKQNSETNFEVFNKCRMAIERLSTSEDLLFVSRDLLGGLDVRLVVDCFESLFSQMLQNKLAASGLLNELYSKFSFDAIARILERILIAKEKIKFNCSQKAIIDTLMLGIVEEKVKWTKRN